MNRQSKGGLYPKYCAANAIARYRNNFVVSNFFFELTAVMDTQRLILWIVFSMSLLFIWEAWQKHNGRPSTFFPTPMATQLGTAKPTSVSSPATVQGAAPGAANTTASASAPVQGEIITVASDVLKLEIDTLGGVVKRATLLRHKAADKADQPFVLLDNAPGKPYFAESGLFGVPDAPDHISTVYTVSNGQRTPADSTDAASVTLTAQRGGLRVTKTYTLPRGSYAVRVTHEVENTGSQPVQPSLYAHLRRHAEKPPGNAINDYFIATFTGPALYTDEQKYQKIPFADIEKGKASYQKNSDNGWVALIQHYFVSAWVPPQKTAREYYAEKTDQPGIYRTGYKTQLPQLAPGSKATHEAQLLIAPQDQDMLSVISPGLDLVVDYTWLTFIAKPMYNLLKFLHDNITGNWGWAIILLTLVIKAVLYYPMAISYKSMAKMKAVMPRVQAMREKYGDDKIKMNQAMMELYKTEKVNPFGGCLPIMLTIPVFLALYWVLLASVEMRHAPWVLWIKDLSVPDPLYILPVVLAVTMWAQFKLSPQPPDPMQARIFMIMQGVFAIMFLFFPAGLVLYYIVNNVLSVAQQKFIYWRLEKSGYSMK
jgi:YidC/Oxa1 family membrane protein insertase